MLKRLAIVPAMVATVATAVAAQAPPERVRTFVDALSPRIATLGPVFLGHLADPLSDAVRNPSLVAGGGQVALVADGIVGAWAVHAMGGSPGFGWSATVGAGPAARLDYSSSSSLLLESSADTATSSLVPAPLMATTDERFEGRIGLSGGLPGGGRLGGAFSYGQQLGRRIEVRGATSPAQSRELGGDGWGATVGWVDQGGAGRQVDFAVHWQDARVQEEVSSFGFGNQNRIDSQQREGWARLVMALGRTASLSVVARRRLVDATDTLLSPFAGPAQDTMVRGTEVAVSLARRWGGDWWTAAAVVGALYQSANGERRFGFSGQPDTLRNRTELTEVGPYVGAAGEAHVVAGIRLRASVVARLARRSTTVESPNFGFPNSTTITTETRDYRSFADVRLGLGYAPPGVPFSFDFHFPNLTEPRRWMVAATRRF